MDQNVVPPGLCCHSASLELRVYTIVETINN